MAVTISLLSSLLFATLCLAHDDVNGMDMSMDMPMNLASGHMLMYFHFTPGDILWFEGWVPQSNGAMVGACIGLFLLALVDRWAAACRGVMEAHWRRRAQITYVNKLNSGSQGKNTDGKGTSHPTPSSLSPSVVDLITMRTVVPFILAHDLVRGIMHAGQAAISFALMLAVMTFQVSFLIAIVVGLGVGETLFGRFSSSHA